MLKINDAKLLIRKLIVKNDTGYYYTSNTGIPCIQSRLAWKLETVKKIQKFEIFLRLYNFHARLD
jgi:hypothetical protein